MERVVAGQRSLSNVTTIACDVDGVVYLGGEGVPGAGAALDRLVAAGFRLIFVTNKSSTTRAEVARAIVERTGHFVEHGDVLTSGVATAQLLRGRIGRALVVGGPGLSATLEEEGIEAVSDWREAEAVVVGLDPSLTYAKLAMATLALHGGAAFYATNTDATRPTEHGEYPGGGAIVAALSTASGREPIVCGKPNGPMRDLVRAAAKGEVLIVGDRPETDLAMGKAEGWHTALVLTGVTAEVTDVPAQWRPDLVLGSIAELPDVLEASSDA